MLRKSTIVFLLVTLGTLALACDFDQMHMGCRITNAQCSCGYGCKSEYRYESNKECRKALKGSRDDICIQQDPCLHEGTCLQISESPGYKCLCEATGYYGAKCENPCSKADLFREPFHHECLEI